MNRFRAVFQLNELASHITDVIGDIESGRYDEDGDLSYEVALSHLMDHLSLAWHYSRMTDEAIDSLSQTEFMLLANAIPKLQVENRLVEPWDDIL